MDKEKNALGIFAQKKGTKHEFNKKKHVIRNGAVSAVDRL